MSAHSKTLQLLAPEEAYDAHPDTAALLAEVEAELAEIWPGYQRFISRHVGKVGSVSVGSRAFSVVKLRGTPFEPVARDQLNWAPVPTSLYKRLKWLLKRHSLLSQGHNCDVQLVQHPKDPRRWIAHPLIMGAGRYMSPRPENEPPRVLGDCIRGRSALALETPVSAPEVAFELGWPLRKVERLLSTKPPGVDALEWVRQEGAE